MGELALTLSSKLRGVPIADQPGQELPPAQRRRLIARAALCALPSTTVHDIVRPHQHPQDDLAAVLPGHLTRPDRREVVTFSLAIPGLPDFAPRDLARFGWVLVIGAAALLIG
jgi:hypothetical protein